MRHVNVARFLPLNLPLSSPELIAEARRAKTVAMLTDVIRSDKLLATVVLASTVSGAMPCGPCIESARSKTITSPICG